MNINNNNIVRIGVLVCTARRPKMLQACLRSVIAQTLPENAHLEICVVENDSSTNSLGIVEKLRSETEIPIHYALEMTRGIPFARNKTLQLALEKGYDFIGLIDDDEEAQTGWIKTHYETLQEFSADVSYGPVDQTFEVPLPFWVRSGQGVLQQTGDVLSRASTNNVFFKAKLIGAPASLSFDNLLQYGYEDLDFFERAHGLGFKIVWSENAVVSEFVVANRSSPERLISFAKSSAAAHVQVGIIRKGYLRTALKFVPKGLRRLISGSLLIAATWPLKTMGLRSGIRVYYRGQMRFARAVGNLRGVFGNPPRYYDVIDGR